MNARLVVITLLGLASLLVARDAAGQSMGIAGREAPELGVTQWFNLPEGVETIDLSDYRGKVVYVFCWQKW